MNGQITFNMRAGTLHAAIAAFLLIFFLNFFHGTSNTSRIQKRDIQKRAVLTDDEWNYVDQRFEAPNTPSSTSEDAPRTSGTYVRQRHSADSESDEDYNAAQSTDQIQPKRKPGGYDSRIEQILYENPELPILITDAGKSLESGGKYIVYTIRTVVWL